MPPQIILDHENPSEVKWRVETHYYAYETARATKLAQPTAYRAKSLKWRIWTMM